MSPFRLDPSLFPNRAKIQFTTSASMPYSIYQACLKTGVVSNTVYCQRALCEALSRDLGIPLQELLDQLPEPRGVAKHLFDPSERRLDRYGVAVDHSGGRIMTGPANTIEEVK